MEIIPVEDFSLAKISRTPSFAPEDVSLWKTLTLWFSLNFPLYPWKNPPLPLQLPCFFLSQPFNTSQNIFLFLLSRICPSLNIQPAPNGLTQLPFSTTLQPLL